MFIIGSFEGIFPRESVPECCLCNPVIRPDPFCVLSAFIINMNPVFGSFFGGGGFQNKKSDDRDAHILFTVGDVQRRHLCCP